MRAVFVLDFSCSFVYMTNIFVSCQILQSDRKGSFLLEWLPHFMIKEFVLYTLQGKQNNSLVSLCVCVVFVLLFVVAVICWDSASLSIKRDFSFCSMSSFQTCSLIESSSEWHFRKCSPTSEVLLQTRCCSCSPAGGVWLAASYTRCARYPDVFLRSHVPKITEAEKPETVWDLVLMNHKIRISPHDVALFLDTSSLRVMCSPTLAWSLGQLASSPFYRWGMGDAARQARLPSSQVI